MLIWRAVNRTFFIILISVVLFIGINSVFYFNIYKQQLVFQTGLLTRQTQLCGASIEQDGQNFENELNYIPFADDFSKLFRDENIRERGAENLQKLYSRYSNLINNVTVFDNSNNVYSLILDTKRNFVSDYYESQQQAVLLERDQLILKDDRFLLFIPEFDESGAVQSNIVVDINFTEFVNAIFEKYQLENTTWQWLISAEGELVSTAENDILISPNDLKKVSAEIHEGNEGSMVHSIEVDGVATRVVSVYYPLRLIQRDMCIVFSIKTDLFLRSIITKILIITLCSLVLLSLLLYLHFRVIRVKSDKDYTQRFSEESLRTVMDTIPVGILLLNRDGSIRLMNLASRELLFKDPSEPYQQYSVSDLDLEGPPIPDDDPLYQRSLGPGIKMKINKGNGSTILYKREWSSEIGNTDTRILILFDITVFEKARNLDNIAHLAKAELLESMHQEISVPLEQIRDSVSGLREQKTSPALKDQFEKLQKSTDLLSNLIDVVVDFAGKDAGQVILEEIPFSLHDELNMALEPCKVLAGKSDLSIITKIRNDLPDDLIGDPFRLRQVLVNLVEMAIELTKEGRILISAETVEHHTDHLKIKFQVEDTGSGMPIEDIEKFLSLPFGASGKMPPGLEKIGFNLAIVQQHVELMKGQLWFNSPSSISTSPEFPGTTCSFTIEVFTSESLKPETIFSDVTGFQDIQCLILSQSKEPPETDRFKLLKDLGINLKNLIYRPDNFESLIGLVDEKSQGVHVFFILDSAEESGFEVAQELEEKGVSTNHIMVLLSSHPVAENQLRCRNLQIDYYIEEPLGSSRLMEIISSHFPKIPGQEMRKAPREVQINPNISILLAEDNLFNRKVSKTLFKSIGYEIDVAQNGIEVIDMIKNREYDIIFMDLLMPEMDGLEATVEIRRLGYKMPVVALTAVDDNETRKTATEAGFSDYLVKPAAVENVREVLFRAISKSE